MKDRIDKVEVRVKYFLTHLMLAYYFTKPTHGKIIKELWGVLMGGKFILKLDPTISSSIKESVGNHLKSSDQAQDLNVIDRARDNYDSHIDKR